MKKIILSIIFSVALCSCATQSENAVAIPTESLSAAPVLINYKIYKISINSQNNNKDVIGNMRFDVASSSFKLIDEMGGSLGILTLQPDKCRNSENSYCYRDFKILGDIALFKTRLSCSIELRNDLNADYSNQAIIGICQDPYRRLFTITLLTN